MAVGYHSRAFHGADDPTSTPTTKGHKEVLAATDKSPPPQVTKGAPRGKTLTKRVKQSRGERGDV